MLELLKELKGIQSLAGLQGLTTRSPCTNGYHHVGITFSKQCVYVFDFNSGIERCAVCLTKFDIVINGFLRDTETWDDVANNTAQFISTLKDNHLNARTRQERSCRKTGGTATDDGDFLAFNGTARSKRWKHFHKAVLCGGKFAATDMNMLINIVTHAGIGAGMWANGTGNKGKGVALKNDTQSVGITTFIYRLKVPRNVLVNRTRITARCNKAVSQRKCPAHVAIRLRFNLFLIARVFK